MKNIKLVIIITVIWVLITTSPEIFIGESWGMMWFIINMPMSIVFENSFGISGDTRVLIFLCTTIQGLIVGSLLLGFRIGSIFLVKAFKRN